MIKDAIFSPCRKYRYSLSRIWDASKPYTLFIGLNPSYADVENDDQTLNRCISFAKSWGYGGVYMANLFAFVHTDRFEMMKAADPIGADNDSHLMRLIDGAGLIVAAWGNEGRHLKRSMAIRQLLPASAMCFVLNATGEPRHPLYMKNDSVLIPLNQ
ncbi:DUF1643 domain-containing protein [Klebsiella quasipneumoniae]|uniref:DUF1643 domain-containing protein n=1 Tax=Klebsiella quasipneumoniae TaxID=1463165 RepID=UPI002378A57D|nr:DUF1643 domain-containing protein [Klebsiella quasipneumoniae]MDD9213723.1 DUF1643 domain-containing protein [Klebsiella quasipneumoniae]